MSADKISLGDSVLKHHFNEVARLARYDTTTLEHHLLKALYANDTDFIARYFQDLPEREEWRKMKLHYDSGFHLSPIQTLKVDEAYRFTSESYGFSIAYDTTVINATSITISKKGNKVNLKGIWAESVWDPTGQEPTYMNIRFKQDTDLKIQYWDTLRQELEYCDYWGLKQDNNSKGTDGSATTVEGYIKGYYGRPDKNHYVYRFVPGNYALNRPIDLVQRLSGRLPNYARWRR
jgi:hypothetical protein